MDADGLPEVVIGRYYEHPEGVASGTAFQLLSPETVERLPFDELRDVDADARFDGVLLVSGRANDFECKEARDAGSDLCGHAGARTCVRCERIGRRSRDPAPGGLPAFPPFRNAPD